MKLSLVERETILLYNQAEPMAEVYTHDPRLMEKLELPGYKGEWFPVPLKIASSAASFPLIKFQLKVGVLSIVLQNHSGIVGLASFLRI